MKKILLVTALIISLLLVSCSASKEEKKETDTPDSPSHLGVEAKTDGFETLEEMEENCDIIIKGIRENTENIVVEKEGQSILSAYTFSSVRIAEIYKDESSSIKKGESITVLENEAYDSETNIIYHIAGYNMMVEKNEYLLFLRRCELEGKVYYVASGVNFGTVSLQDDGRTKEYNTSAGYPAMECEAYKTIWNLAKEKYGIASK